MNRSAINMSDTISGLAGRSRLLDCGGCDQMPWTGRWRPSGRANPSTPSSRPSRSPMVPNPWRRGTPPSLA